MIPDIDALVSGRHLAEGGRPTYPVPPGFPPVLGFCGPAGAGKTTAARFFERHYGQAFTRVRFAGPLKDMLRALGLTEAEVDGADKERPSDLLGGKTPRQAMQTLGTEWGRVLVDPGLWLNAWAARADTLIDRGGRVVADDVRFPNEAAAIWQRGGKVVHIRNLLVSPKPHAHISETIGFPWDAEIINPGADLAAFHEALAGLVF